VDFYRRFLALTILLLGCAMLAQQASSQQAPRFAHSGDRSIHLDVFVTSKSGSVVSGLSQNDFTILDNKVRQTITSFQPVNGTVTPAKMIIVLDAVNSAYRRIGYERQQIDHFLRADSGELANPTAIFVLTDLGIHQVSQFSTNGNKLSAELRKYTVSLRFFRRDQGFYVAAERLEISLTGFHNLLTQEASVPGRKIMVWISPGWPILSGPEVELDNHEEREVFGDIVYFSTELRQERMTGYVIDPNGMNDSLSRDSYWAVFSNGISRPSQANFGNVSLQVLSAASGGQVFSFYNDIVSLLHRCVRDTSAYYEISFEPAPGRRPDEYHRLQVRIAKHGLTAHTWQGYYSGSQAPYGNPAVPPPAGLGLRRSLR
jgi:VWFA-related protein